MRALLYRPNGVWVDKGGGVETMILYQNYGEDGVWRDYDIVGESLHRFQPGASFKSEAQPDVHSVSSESFECFQGSFAIFTIEDGQKQRYELYEGDMLRIPAGVPHWGGSLAPDISIMKTTLNSHREYQGSTPWRSDAVLN